MDDIEGLLIDVRADTSGFAADVARMRASFDSELVNGFAQAGDVLERGLLAAIRRGSVGFEDLRRVAISALDKVAARALDLGLERVGLGGSDGALGGVLGPLVKGLVGAPGRATGGPVSPQRPYLVGERGPELFVPTAAGRVEAPPLRGPAPQAIQLTIVAPRETAAPVAMQRSSRQLAAALVRGLNG